MSELDSVVIAGGGLAGASAAFALRQRGFDTRLIRARQERSAPLVGTPQSKGNVRGESSLDQALVRPLAEYDARG
jgi:3-phenylpropionate/trans-cinnamate dioxygenase ferredoxin reductase subunit